MIKSSVIISNIDYKFNDSSSALEKLYSDIGSKLLEKVGKTVLELEYEGVVLHTYNRFNKETQEITQVFATNDLTALEDRLYTSSEFREAFDCARSKGWKIAVAIL